MLKKLQKATGIIVMLCALFGSLGAYAQNRAISGKVVDASGQPVVGAAVMVVGNSRIGTSTDLNGAFTLNVPAGANIAVESIGYKTQSFAVGNQTTFNIVLEEDAELLEETVVIGYGVQKKSDVTGAIASVKESDLENRTATDVAQAIQGKAAGVQIVNSSGAPGAASSIQIRGYSSNSRTSPLMIVDGLKVTDISYLDPETIASIEILKDAASAAI
jgi:outer membrane receptor protein involved in Fe transport